MRSISILLMVVALFSAPGVNAEPLCERLAADPLLLKSERKYLLGLCEAEIAKHPGPIVLVEGGFLPFPEHFYLRIPTRSSIELSSGLLLRITGYEEALNWPYSTIRITQSSESLSGRLSSERLIESPGLDWASRMCLLPIDLQYFEESWPGTSFVGQFFRLHIGRTEILLSGDSRNLAVVLAETYARWNCVGVERQHQDNDHFR